MAIKTRQILLIGILALLGGCTQSSRPATSTSTASLAGKDWVLASLNGRPIEVKQPPTLRFSEYDKRVSGFGGINRISSAYTIDGTCLTFAQFISTKMAGDPALMELEGEFLKVLSSVDRFQVEGAELRLFSKEVSVATFH